MQNSIEKLKTSIYLIMCMLFTILVYAYFYEVFVKRLSNDYTSIYIGSIIIIGIVICDYFSRRYISNLIIFTLVHLGFIVLTLIIPHNTMDKVLLTTVAAAFFIMGISFWKKEEDSTKNIIIEVPLGLIIFFIFSYVHSSISFSKELAIYSYISGIAYFILFYIREYIEKFLSLPAGSEKNTKEILNTFSTNFSLIILFNLIIVSLICISSFIYSGTLLNKIWLVFQRLFRRIFSVFKNGDGVISEELPTEATDIGSQIEETTAPPVPDMPVHSSKLLATLFDITVVIIFIAIFAVIIYLLYSFVKNHINRHIKTDDIVQKINKEEKTDKPVKEKKKHSFSIFMSNRDKIRKIYAGRVDSYVKTYPDIVVRKSHTPGEIKHNIKKAVSDTDGRFDTLTNIYEKARYSDKEITKEDMELTKN